MAVRNGKVFGQTVNEATTPPTPTPLTDFTSAFGAVTVDCASVTIQGTANVFVTVRTNTDQLLEVGCVLNNFPTSCGGTVVNLGTIPMAARGFLAAGPGMPGRTPPKKAAHSKHAATAPG
ncbi:hypothetical protein [Actinomadura violacea]|uniref:Uncharacterized protein n=1 Tax=Actinomadura violacea TaxID=2819934 RepID=A0ABS3RMT0_9ACTN|nr:hypothetical protein [Actinomadura violacea]MBO2458055.1 hypothetical protein [Actinomadura violacea]